MRAGGVLGQILSACILLFAVVLFNFILLHAAPGDPAEALASATGGATKEILDEIRRTYGLDQPLYLQFLRYVGNVLRGDFGNSIYFNAPVAGLISSARRRLFCWLARRSPSPLSPAPCSARSLHKSPMAL